MHSYPQWERSPSKTGALRFQITHYVRVSIPLPLKTGVLPSGDPRQKPIWMRYIAMWDGGPQEQGAKGAQGTLCERRSPQGYSLVRDCGGLCWGMGRLVGSLGTE